MQTDSWCPLQAVLCWERHACFLGVAIRYLWNYLNCLFPYVSFGSLQEFFSYVKLKKTPKTLHEINWNFLALAFTCCMLSPATYLDINFISFLLWKWTKFKILYRLYLLQEWICSSIPSQFFGAFWQLHPEGCWAPKRSAVCFNLLCHDPAFLEVNEMSAFNLQ